MMYSGHADLSTGACSHLGTQGVESLKNWYSYRSMQDTDWDQSTGV